MRRPVALLLSGAGIFLLGAFVATIVIWKLNDSGMIFTTHVIPNPVFEAVKKGHYDEAINLALADIHDENKDYFQYHQLVYVYLVRAYKDEPHREQWAGQALSYIDKEVSLAPDDVVHLLEVAHEYEQAGDLSKNGCPSYTKGEKLCERLDGPLSKDSLMVRDFKSPTKEIRQENKALEARFVKKLGAWCGGVGN